MWGNIKTATESLVVEVEHSITGRRKRIRKTVPVGSGRYYLGRADDGELGMGNTLLEAISRWGSRKEIIYGLYLFEERGGVLRIRDIIAEGYFPWVSRYHLRLDVSGGRLRITKRWDSAPVMVNGRPFSETTLDLGKGIELNISPVAVKIRYTIPKGPFLAVDAGTRKTLLRLIEATEELLKANADKVKIYSSLRTIDDLLGDRKFSSLIPQFELIAAENVKLSEDTVRVVRIELERLKEKLVEELW